MEFDIAVRMAVYDHIVRDTFPPTIQDVSATIGASGDEVRAAYQRLLQKRVLVLEEDGERIRMAPPFAGVETQHRVAVGRKEYFANCAWDALGVAAALHSDAEVHSRCEQSLEPLHIPVRGGRPHPEPCVVHFAVPAAHWWDDIVYT